MGFRKILCIFVVGIIIFFCFDEVKAQEANKNLVNIYFFHSSDCSHCKEEGILLDSLEKSYSNIKIYRFEIHKSGNNDIRAQVQDLYGIKTVGVPLTVIGDTAYMGYSSEGGRIKFIKTVEYYSRYGYEDKVGNLLQLDTLSSYSINEGDISIDEFMDTYLNYPLYGNVYTDDLDVSLNAIVLGFLSQFNLVSFFNIVFIFCFIFFVKDRKNRMLLLFFCFVISFLLKTLFVISNLFSNLVILGIILLFMLEIIQYIRYRKKEYLYYIFLIVLVGVISYLEQFFCFRYYSIFKKLIWLHQLYGIEKFNYYINYFFTVVIVNILFVLIIYSINRVVLFIKYKFVS